MDTLQAWNCWPLGVADIADVMALERMCFRTRWTREQFLLGLERGAFQILGTRERGALLGYVAYSLIAGEMEILNIATHPFHRRKGLATRLLGAAIDCCQRRGAGEGFLEVRRSNIPAIDLYRKFGFIEVGVRKNYYPDNHEDALLFRLDFLPLTSRADQPT
ncbi:ribosomal-protein-alanine N-acetyltransferase [Humidesulfovibrio mexicanus]|uniref:Ribosomal-protein-alanine N-acetyltransferase n=1 Tax=Humidesulfovibrio mexicanus TaxID=147047 RepID=A0A238XKU7_9BACT|nr:ribosomal protein S18-alanine N-acetyltransferase [Humidesulfovibrio mexicanus]SNR59093.1 ribosomal-protein-alanine N-acetyltransferase [Humidesulfovibrio mexicanus]